jgi:uncharacterized RDD family membrane protein YckC
MTNAQMAKTREPQPVQLQRRLSASLCNVWPLLFYEVVAALLIRWFMPVWAGIALIYVVPVVWLAVNGAVHRATFGMRVMSIHIGSGDGGAISFWRCFTRILLGIALLPLMPVSLLMAGFDSRHRMLADRICGTAVWMTPRPAEQAVGRGFEIAPLESRQHI